jgi:outer membrane protein TolC
VTGYREEQAEGLAMAMMDDREDAINDAVSDYRIALIDQAQHVEALSEARNRADAARDAAEAARDACESAEILLVQANERRAKAHKAFVMAVTGRDG